ncbi:MAG: hypothetical protein R8M14_01575 [Ghiorsea sp.]
MQYIKCTHCGKRYAVNEKIIKSEGDFVRCKNCLEKFMIVVHDSEKHGLETEDDGAEATEGWDPTLTLPPHNAEDLIRKETHPSPSGGISSDSDEMDWDPSQTMPEVDTSAVDDEEEALSDEEIQAKAEAALAAVKKEKKKKLLMGGILGVTLLLLVLTLYMALFDDAEQIQSVKQTTAKHVSPEVLDKNSSECRMAAAKLWHLDNRAMNTDYSGEVFLELIEKTQSQEALLGRMCKNRLLSKQILEAATAQKQPEWFASEIQTIQVTSH